MKEGMSLIEDKIKSFPKIDVCQISLTGARAIFLLGLLLKAPRSLEEIREQFLKAEIIDADSSSDILRIDINTLRSMGCEISRAGKSTGGKFVLKKHPFSMNMAIEEMSVLRRAFNVLRSELSIQELLQYDALFKKIAKHISDDGIREELYGLTVLKKYNSELIEELLNASESKSTLELLYKNPVSKKDEIRNIVAEQVVLKNDKIYLYGFNIDKKAAVTLNIKRIKEILSRSDSSNSFDIEQVVVKFKLKDFGVTGLEECEKVLESVSDGYVVQGTYFNEFIAMQRILSFGSACTVLEPDNFKEKVIKILKEIRSIYNG